MGTESRAKPTSLDVARRAGLSRSAVSQILNGNTERFPAETRERVANAVAELNYRPSRVGRALVRGVSDVIMVVVPNVTFGRHLQDAVEQLAHDTKNRGYSVVVRYAGTEPRTAVSTVLDMAPSSVVDLGVFNDEERAKLRAAGIVLLLDPDLFPEDFVDANYRIGELQASEMLKDPTRQLVYAMLEDERQDANGPTRLVGAAATAAALGCAAPLPLRIPLERTEATNRLAAVIHGASERFGVCCYNDEVAIAVAAAAAELGLAVPDRIAIIGADATEVGQLITPRLTTVAVDTAQILKHYIAAAGTSTLFSASEPIFTHIDRFVRVVPGRTS